MSLHNIIYVYITIKEDSKLLLHTINIPLLYLHKLFSLLTPLLAGADKDGVLTWARDGQPIDHVVLGRSEVGGAWQVCSCQSNNNNTTNNNNNNNNNNNDIVDFITNNHLQTQSMDQVQMQTLSLGKWMELPGYSFSNWAEQHLSEGFVGLKWGLWVLNGDL